MKNYLKNRITAYWMNAKIDYNINGRFIDCRTIDNDRLGIEWEEEGTKYFMVINYYKTYSPEEVFNIWMESDWSFWAD